MRKTQMKKFSFLLNVSFLRNVNSHLLHLFDFSPPCGHCSGLVNLVVLQCLETAAEHEEEPIGVEQVEGQGAQLALTRNRNEALQRWSANLTRVKGDDSRDEQDSREEKGEHHADAHRQVPLALSEAQPCQKAPGCYKDGR